ncbi:hypothetical protein RchiOBHm_Chr6g0275311 [Rosa chinensis]|uniref:Uncharacterized protein n=1 Tax=Rosa chinensis TaxID=74649 RepID=A0A2P6PRZ0_ROSCH|nr:hypothetical protein RchiOBHm_Chr6g0275311 [Rosa chinensis]
MHLFLIRFIFYFLFLWQSGAMQVRLLVIFFLMFVDILRDSKGNLPRMLKNLDPFFMLFICNEWMNKYPIVRWHEIGNLFC